MSKRLIIIIVAVVIVVAGALAAYFLIFRNTGEEEEEHFVSFYVPGEYIVTNIKDSSRLLKAAPVLAFDIEEIDAKMLEYLDGNQTIMRDRMTRILRNKTEEELKSDGIQDTLSTEIVEALKQDLEVEALFRVYFNDFVVQ